jgi:hypothetical protein
MPPGSRGAPFIFLGNPVIDFLMSGLLALAAAGASDATDAAATAEPVACSSSDRAQTRADQLAKASLKNVEACAQSGDAVAINEAGRRYGLGQGVEKDAEKSFGFYRQAATLGYAQGKTNLAYMYFNGEGTKQDYDSAYRWATAAAEDGNAAGQHVAGYMIVMGKGVKPDGKLAEKWFLAAANQGFVLAQDALVTLYSDGKLMPAQSDKAVLWLHRVRDARLFGRTWSQAAEAQEAAGGSQAIGGGMSLDVPAGWKFERWPMPEPNQTNIRIHAEGLKIGITGFPIPEGAETVKVLQDLDATLVQAMTPYLSEARESAVQPTGFAAGEVRGSFGTLSAKPGGKGFAVFPTTLSPSAIYQCVTTSIVRTDHYFQAISIASDDCTGARHQAGIAMLKTIRLSLK